MKPLIIIPILLFTQIILAAQSEPISGKGKSVAKIITIKKQQEDYILIDWLAPSGNAINSEEDKVEIKVKIISAKPINRANIIVLNNGQKISSKADEVSLFGNVEETEINYQTQVRLSEGENVIKVGLKEGTQSTYSIPKVLLLKEGEIVEASPSYLNFGKAVASHVYWKYPDPLVLQGRPLVRSERELLMELIIQHPGSLEKRDIKIIHNKFIKPIPSSARLKKIGEGKYALTHTIQLNDRYDINEIAVRVKGSFGEVDSEKLRINFAPFRPNLHLIAIGTQTNLEYTVKDAKDFSQLFQKQRDKKEIRLFNSIQVNPLLGAQASAAEIKGQIEELKVKFETGNIRPKDVVMLFISSHGFLDAEKKFRIQGDDYHPARPRSTSVSYQEDIIRILEDLPCKKIVFVDACHSGGGARSNVMDINYEIEKLNKSKTGTTVIVSSRAEEESYEDVRWQNGAFTEAILQGLAKGKADTDQNKIITINELFRYVSLEVPNMVGRFKKKPQHPKMLNDELGDVAIYVVSK